MVQAVMLEELEKCDFFGEIRLVRFGNG